ncbi:MAG: adenylyltransferase/cytidyltransferase family protein [Deltaproteobacteria bacterium]|nr:adenylyltransferase/cytidyltransferase family protein [Deltaproteobacteria bacterium]
MDKIKTIDELSAITKRLRSENKKIVYCHGVFDLLHIGHIRHFKQASQLGDVLVVTITEDRFVDKGPHRPAFSEDLRAEAVASLKFVDYVAINRWPTAEESLRLLRPHVYVKGSEFKKSSSDITGKIAKEKEIVQEIGAEIAFTEDVVFSSTNLINRHLSNLSQEINEYLRLFRQRYRLEDILQILDRMASLRVLVIGDTILDEYQFCQAIGKSSKDPTLALKYQSHDLFAGGVLAVANHVADFAGAVHLVTVLGEQDSHEAFVRSQLHPGVSPHFVMRKQTPTLIKRRFIDGYSFNKLFEVYVMGSPDLPSEADLELCSLLREQIAAADIVLVADYGHGAITEKTVQLLSNEAKFLAVNTQANAGNRGFNTISKYPRADYVCIAEHELRLETRKHNGSVIPLMHAVARGLSCSQMVVTHGRKGCTVYDREGSAVKVPSFAHNVVDRVGAGDTFLSISSLAAVQKVGNEVLGFLGNVVGSLAVQVLGNKKPINKSSVQNYIVSLLK